MERAYLDVLNIERAAQGLEPLFLPMVRCRPPPPSPTRTNLRNGASRPAELREHPCRAKPGDFERLRGPAEGEYGCHGRCRTPGLGNARPRRYPHLECDRANSQFAVASTAAEGAVSLTARTNTRGCSRQGRRPCQACPKQSALVKYFPGRRGCCFGFLGLLPVPHHERPSPQTRTRRAAEAIGRSSSRLVVRAYCRIKVGPASRAGPKLPGGWCRSARGTYQFRNSL